MGKLMSFVTAGALEGERERELISLLCNFAPYYRVLSMLL